MLNDCFRSSAETDCYGERRNSLLWKLKPTPGNGYENVILKNPSLFRGSSGTRGGEPDMVIISH